MNSISTVAAKWFPIQERATASGLALVANFLGIAIGQVLSPVLFLRFGIANMLLIYGGIAAFTAIIFVIFTREAPPTPPCPQGMETRALMLDGLKSMLRMKDVWIMLGLFLVGMGIFNGISTWIESIVRSRGFSISQAGNLGGVLLFGGIAGAIVLPIFSDRLHKRKIFMLLGMALAIPGMIGVIFANQYWLTMVSMFFLGIFPYKPCAGRLPVCCRNNASGTGRHIKRASESGRPGICGLYLWHGSAKRKRWLIQAFAAGSCRFNGFVRFPYSLA